MVYTYMQILSLPKKKVFEGELPENWKEESIEWLELKMNTNPWIIDRYGRDFFRQLWNALDILEKLGLRVWAYRRDLIRMEMEFLEKKIKELEERMKELEQMNPDLDREDLRKLWKRWWNA